jgi:hypothetical protein
MAPVRMSLSGSASRPTGRDASSSSDASFLLQLNDVDHSEPHALAGRAQVGRCGLPLSWFLRGGVVTVRHLVPRRHPTWHSGARRGHTARSCKSSRARELAVHGSSTHERRSGTLPPCSPAKGGVEATACWVSVHVHPIRLQGTFT